MASVADFLSQIKAYGQSITGAPPVDIFSGSFSRSAAPFVIGKAGTEAEGLIDDGMAAAFSEFAEGYGQSERQRQDDQRYALAEAGVNPLMARSYMAEQDAGRGSEVARFRAGLEKEAAGQKLDVLGELSSGLIQSEQYQDSLDLQKYISDQQAKAAKKAGKFSMIGNIVGAGLNLLAPGAGLFTSGLFGGGGTPGMNTPLNAPSELGATLNFGGGGGANPWAMQSSTPSWWNSPLQGMPLSYNALDSKVFEGF